MKGIYVIEFSKDKKSVLLDAGWLNEHDINKSEAGFLNYIIPQQYPNSVLGGWMVLKLDNIMEYFNTSKATVSKWLKKLEKENILIHEDFRSPLWKINKDVIEVKKFYKD
ncbi:MULTISPECIES: hypothetical protein [Clostridium]|uniref:HTH crp-type domain-containing protein n=1 Tax=Clostridium botulinum (strain Langeland / NCTC 10281 / Type F) TaxID=441772 RepID=A7GEH6_CLOBL|nr:MULTISPECIES: hypothetical protein [Clostridium]ABS39344.1 hypothetical protein CLI_1928 [Clostridium botulinum F str. Langeland]ADF99602.1 hypothetical protein CBF_1908 [Clostridium botulinum F str. 230613]KKM42823.1 hypothetical protein VT72_04065 [Clostridium botulinum]KOY66338.1 hypothetical protein AN649_08525 [Clostridium sporogenes]MBY6791660.1 hypothetical protein [Clostridium botulinum]